MLKDTDCYTLSGSSGDVSGDEKSGSPDCDGCNDHIDSVITLDLNRSGQSLHPLTARQPPQSKNFDKPVPGQAKVGPIGGISARWRADTPH